MTTADWTPVETKPKPGVRVLVTVQSGCIEIAMWKPHSGGWTDEADHRRIVTVLAWAPLPAPYVPGGAA